MSTETIAAGNIKRRVWSYSGGSWSANPSSGWNTDNNYASIGKTSYRTILKIPVKGVSDGRKNVTLSLKNLTYITNESSIPLEVSYYIYAIDGNAAQALAKAENGAKREGEPSSGDYIASGKISLKNTSTNTATTTLTVSNLNIGQNPGDIYILFTRSNSLMRLTNFTSYTATIATTSYSYTACQAPPAANIKIKGYSTYKIVKPNETITVEWSEAKSGTNNAISKYIVSVGAFANSVVTSLVTTTVATSSTSGSANLILPATAANYRGCSLHITISVYGEKYNPTTIPSSSKTFGQPSILNGNYGPLGCWINRLPASPIVHTDGKLPSTGSGKIIFTIIPDKGSEQRSEDNDNNYYKTETQEISYWYNSTNSTSGAAQYINKQEVTISSEQVYFWAYDGKEYSSSPTVVRITRAPKPSITTVEKPSPIYVKAKGQERTYCYKANFTVTASNSSKITPILQFSKNQIDIIEEIPWTNKASSSFSKTELSIADELSNTKVDLNYNDTYWRINFIPSSEIESGNGTHSDWLIFPGAPTVTAYYNTKEQQNREETSLMGDVVRIEFPEDGICSYDSNSIEVDRLDGARCSSASSSQSYVTLSLDQGITGGITTPILVLSGKTEINSKFKRRIPLSFEIIPKPQMGVFSFPNVKPFSATGTLQATLQALDGGNTSTTAWSGAAVQYRSQNGEWFEAFAKGDFVNSSDVTKQLSIDATKIYKDDWKSNLGINKYNSVYTCSARAVLTNVFGQKFYSNPATFTLDFSEKPSIKSKSFFIQNTTGWITFSKEGNLLQEGKFKIEVSPQSLSEGSGEVIIREGNIQRGKSSFSIDSPSYNEGKWTSGSSNPNSVEVSFDIPEITNFDPKTYEIVVNGPGGSYSETVTFQVAPQYDPNIVITDVSLSENEKTLTIEFSKNADPSVLSFTFGAYTGKVSGNKVSFSSSGKFFGDNWTTKDIQLQVKSTTCTSRKISGITYTPCFKREKNYLSNLYVFYNTVPTVAYRENHLGINTSTPDGDTIFDIRALTGKQKIQFKDEATKVTFILDSKNKTFTVKNDTTEYVITFD